jgi:hypothetical protein
MKASPPFFFRAHSAALFIGYCVETTGEVLREYEEDVKSRLILLTATGGRGNPDLSD